MRIKDVKPGVVYGHRRGAYGTITPVVFLAAPGPDRLYSIKQYPKPGAPVHEHHPNLGRPQRSRRYGFGPDVGYPVVFGRSEGTDLAVLASVTLDDFLAATKTFDEDRDIRYGVVVTMAHIVGPYDAAIAEEERRQAAERERYAEERTRREAAQQRAERLMEALTAHGVTAERSPYYEPTALVSPLDDVEKLLGLLGGERA